MHGTGVQSAAQDARVRVQQDTARECMLPSTADPGTQRVQPTPPYSAIQVPANSTGLTGASTATLPQSAMSMQQAACVAMFRHICALGTSDHGTS